ncbi:acyltransferase family protein [Oleiharenicola sp. Vm1]|uniref:acyltransferase family protein n=1 Tax=Oleiharenicola sp. Vm1 TaxID=3398393 RepID=UPI0039F64745
MKSGERLLSLDAFRGATIAGMLLVNNPGSWSAIYPPLEHAKWHGWTFTDTIFPSFLWIVGVSLTLSTARRVEAGADRAQLFRHVLQRAAIIFGLGLLLAAFPFGLLPTHHLSFATLRLPGVLQRIAVCYLVASAIFLRTGWRGQLAWAGALLLGYWALLALVPVPGYGPGVLEPKGSLAWWIDSHLLAGHTWSGAPAPGFDPEGSFPRCPRSPRCWPARSPATGCAARVRRRGPRSAWWRRAWRCWRSARRGARCSRSTRTSGRAPTW